MKKSRLLVFSLLAAMCIVTGCNKDNNNDNKDTTPAHEHSYTDVKSDAEGHWYECSADHAANTKVAHTWNDGAFAKDADKPTCTENGTKTYTCTVCGYTKTESVAALGHIYAKTVVLDHNSFNVTDNAVISNCISGAIKLDGAKAENPNNTTPKIYAANEHFRIYIGNTLTISIADETSTNVITKVQFSNNKKLSVNGESLNVWEGSADSITFSATAKTEIYTISVTYTCSAQDAALQVNRVEPDHHTAGSYGLEATCTRCEHKETFPAVTLPIVDHDSNLTYVYDKEEDNVTTKADGKHYQVCSCGDHLNEGDHTWITVEGTSNIKWTDDPAPTCNEGGKHYKECSVCHAKVYEDTDALGGAHPSFTLVNATDPTFVDGVEVAGCVAHYECSVCHAAAKDANGTEMYDDDSYIVHFSTIEFGGTTHYYLGTLGNTFTDAKTNKTYKLFNKVLNVTADDIVSQYSNTKATQNYAFGNVEYTSIIKQKVSDVYYFQLHKENDSPKVNSLFKINTGYLIKSINITFAKGSVIVDGDTENPISTNGVININAASVELTTTVATQFVFSIDYDEWVEWDGDEAECTAAIAAVKTSCAFSENYYLNHNITLPTKSADGNINFTYELDGNAITELAAFNFADVDCGHTLKIIATVGSYSTYDTVSYTVKAYVERTGAEIAAKVAELAAVEDDINNTKDTLNSKFTGVYLANAGTKAEIQFSYEVEEVPTTFSVYVYNGVATLAAAGYHINDTVSFYGQLDEKNNVNYATFLSGTHCEYTITNGTNNIADSFDIVVNGNAATFTDDVLAVHCGDTVVVTPKAVNNKAFNDISFGTTVKTTTNAAYTFTVAEDITLNVNYITNEPHTVTYTDEHISIPNAVENDSTYSITVNVNTVLTVTVTIPEGQTINWVIFDGDVLAPATTGDDSNTYSLTVSKDGVLTVDFKQPTVYTKVTQSKEDWSGTYLIGYIDPDDANNVHIFNGNWTSSTLNEVSASVSNNKITTNDSLPSITLAKLANGKYTVKLNSGSNSGKYLSTSAPSKAAINVADSGAEYDVSLDDNGFIIISTPGSDSTKTFALRYNPIKSGNEITASFVKFYNKADNTYKGLYLFQ